MVITTATARPANSPKRCILAAMPACSLASARAIRRALTACSPKARTAPMTTIVSSDDSELKSSGANRRAASTYTT